MGFKKYRSKTQIPTKFYALGRCIIKSELNPR